MKRSRLNLVSAKRRSEQTARAKVRDIVHARDQHCVARLVVPEIECGGPLDVDEIVLRSGRPGGHLDPDNCQLLCRRHHDWKHANPAAAVDRGLRRWSYD